MKNKVDLPLVEPVFRTYNHLANGSAILFSNPTIRNWYLNDVCSLCCTKKFLEGYTSPQLTPLRGTHHSNPNIERVSYNTRFTKGYTNCIIKILLDNGYYVCFDKIDDFYIKGKSWYREKHFPHDGMIYGYDDEKGTYSILAYDSNWIHRSFDISQKDFNKARNKLREIGVYSRISGIKPRDTVVELDAEKILKELEKYITEATGKRLGSSEEIICGIAVHEYIAKYIDKLISGEIPYDKMDRRVFCMLWEHKKLMSERLRKVEETLGIDSSCSFDYEKIVRDANHMRLLYASHHAKRRDAVLPVIKNTLLKLCEAEKIILEDFLVKAKAKVNL